MGDSEGDPRMGEGLEHKTELKVYLIIANCKIGYLNHDVEELLEKYMDLYDIVVLDDPPLSLANDIINEILKQ
jgi:hypothetical protein